MKKLLLLLTSAVVYFNANAIDLTFWIDNQKITPGETIEFSDITINKDEGYCDVKMKPELYLTTNIFSSDIKITATCTSGQTIGLCAGGQCIGGVTAVKENVTVRPNQKLDLGFDFIGEFDLDEPIPTVITTIEAEDITESESKIQFVIKMGEKSASVSVVEISDEIRAVEGAIAFNVEYPGELTVSTLSGANVFSGIITGEGSISLPKGIYVYSFNGRAGKLIIR